MYRIEYFSEGRREWSQSAHGPFETLDSCFQYFNYDGTNYRNYRAVCQDTEAIFNICLAGVAQPFPTFPTQEAQIMPNPSPAPIQHAPNSLVKINVSREKPSNKLILTIDAKPLHDLLDSIGVPVDGNRYADRPSCSFEVVRESLLSSELFLKREYPVRANLSAIWSQPPTIQRLRDICNSSHEVVRKILAHYQPIDISVTIQKMVIG